MKFRYLLLTLTVFSFISCSEKKELVKDTELAQESTDYVWKFRSPEILYLDEEFMSVEDVNQFLIINQEKIPSYEIEPFIITSEEIEKGSIQLKMELLCVDSISGKPAIFLIGFDSHLAKNKILFTLKYPASRKDIQIESGVELRSNDDEVGKVGHIDDVVAFARCLVSE